MNVKYEFRPLPRWTDPETAIRQSSARFKIDPDMALIHVRDEVAAVRGKLLVIELVCEPDQIRLDGILRAGAKVTHPGVVVSFDSDKGPLRFACDTYVKQWSHALDGWAANLRAIGLTLESLRAIDRHGAASRHQQYTGWAQIEAGANGSSMTRADALELVKSFAPANRHNEPLERVVRWAKAGAHPDRHGGDRTGWNQVEEAARVLGVTS